MTDDARPDTAAGEPYQALITCNQCAHQVPRLEYCIRCGDPLSDDRKTTPRARPVGGRALAGHERQHDRRRGHLPFTLHDAGPGWDYSTGLGSPRVAPLARAIVDFLAR